MKKYFILRFVNLNGREDMLTRVPAESIIRFAHWYIEQETELQFKNYDETIILQLPAYSILSYSVEPQP